MNFKSTNKFSAAFFLIAALFINAAAQKEELCKIHGKIIDDRQKTVADSYLHWYPKDGGGLDFISVNGKSEKDGSFEFREMCLSGDLTLYVTSSLSFENYVPILPPFAYGSKLDKNVKGLPIKNVKNREINLGNVPVQVYYSTVSIHFTDDSGNNLFSSKKDWENASIRFKDKSGKRFSEEKLDSGEIEKAVRISDSILTIDLPAEDWLIEIKPDQDKKLWLRADKLISIEKNAGIKKISLRMAKTN